MKVLVSADDYGASRGITDAILDAADHGAVTHVSILPNGAVFDYAVEQLRKRPDLGWSLHLNLFEGRPLCPPSEIPLLAGAMGLRHSFLSLWHAYVMANAETRREWKRQVRRELEAQFERVASRLGVGSCGINGHQYVHLIPFVFDVLMDLSEQRAISYVRIVQEPMIVVPNLTRTIAALLGPNLIKHYLLNCLSRRAKHALIRKTIPHCDAFVGVLFSGMMSADVVRGARESLARSGISPRLLEIVFHPGGAAGGEEAIWRGARKEFAAFYYSKWRRRERDVLKSDNLQRLLAEWKGSPVET